MLSSLRAFPWILDEPKPDQMPDVKELELLIAYPASPYDIPSLHISHFIPDISHSLNHSASIFKLLLQLKKRESFSFMSAELH